MLEIVTAGSVTSWLTIGAICLLLLMVVRKPRGLPPGPLFTFPILGHILLLGPDVLGAFRRMRKKYGDIYHVYMGSNLVIVLNGYDVLKEAFVKHGDVFSERPNITAFADFGANSGIVSTSGHVWKEQRKFALGALREFGMGKNILQWKIMEEVKEFLEVLEEEKASAFDISDGLHAAVSNVICSIVYGRRFHYQDPKFRRSLKALEENFRVGIGAALANWLPFLRKLPGDVAGYNRFKRNIDIVRFELTEPLIEEHLEHFHPDAVNDFMDAYIKQMKENEDKGVDTTITKSKLWRVINDLFVAGTESSGTTIRWALLHLLHHPDLQERLHRELQDKVGSGRLPVLEDRAELPLLDAFISEVQRKYDITPLALPHGLKEDFVLRGYHIPKDAVVFPNLDSVLNDPDVWGDPDVFRPERFLQDGKVVKPEEFIPFSIGRRQCLGESLARMELFLFLSAMMQRFRFKPPENQPLPDLQGILGVSYSPKPFQIRVVPYT